MLADITGFYAEACRPLNGPLFLPLNPLYSSLYSIVGVGVTRPPLCTNWSSRVLQAISSVMQDPKLEQSALVSCDIRWISLYNSGHRVREFHMFLGCNNPLCFQQHDEKLGHAHCSCRDWIWTHQQITLETSDDGLSSGAVCSHLLAAAMVKCQSGASGWIS